MSIDATTCPSPRADVADEPALLPLVGRDTLVPLVDGRHVTYANLDVAASAPALEAVAARDRLIEQLCALPAVSAALDELIRHFGTERVAEVTFGQLQEGRFRHGSQFLHWRTDRDPSSCTYDQLEVAASVPFSAVVARAQ